MKSRRQVVAAEAGAAETSGSRVGRGEEEVRAVRVVRRRRMVEGERCMVGLESLCRVVDC